VRMYAEVYGTVVGQTEMKAACWIGGYSNVVKGQIEMEFNKNWLLQAGVSAPLVLRSVTVFDADVHIPLDVSAELRVQSVHIRFSPRMHARLADAPPTEG
jgi:hypothetical protein